MTHQKSIFEKIADGEIPGSIVHRDDICFVIEDIHPQGPVHLLVIPLKRVERLAECTVAHQQTLGHLLLTAAEQAKKRQLNKGFRIVINNGPDGGETVPHLHVHVIGGRRMAWPPG